MLRVNEIFDSLQGEGLHIGRLATFVRLQGCNLNCSWCDTPGAKAPMTGEMMDEDDIVKSVYHRLVILTGGEPLIQDVSKLVAMLKLTKHEIHIETNGSKELRARLCDSIDFWTVSPKREAEHGAEMFIRDLLDYDTHGQIKFVIRCRDQMECEEDTKWARAFSQDAFMAGVIKKGRIFPVVLQPNWIHPDIKDAPYRDTYELRYKQLAYMIKQRWPNWDVRLIPQVHKLLRLDRVCHKTIGRKKT